MCDGQPSSDVLLLSMDTAFRYRRNKHLSLDPLGRAKQERTQVCDSTYEDERSVEYFMHHLRVIQLPWQQLSPWQRHPVHKSLQGQRRAHSRCFEGPCRPRCDHQRWPLVVGQSASQRSQYEPSDGVEWTHDHDNHQLDTTNNKLHYINRHSTSKLQGIMNKFWSVLFKIELWQNLIEYVQLWRPKLNYSAK